LLRCLSAIEGVKPDNDDERIGVDIVKRAIEYPTRAWLKRRCGRLVLCRKSRSAKATKVTTSRRRIRRPREGGVVDPKKVTRTASAERGFDRRSAPDHRMPHHRDPEKDKKAPMPGGHGGGMGDMDY
jgi:chaperonin GroEL